MPDNNQEIEVKFYVTGLDAIRNRLRVLGAHLVQERILEKNIRFDLPDARLRSEGRVLRLRRDTEVRLTYKGASTNEQGVLSRTEIEFVVEDFEKAKQFLEALGYRKLLSYDKYREVHELDECHVMLDELPYGCFIEIEGQSVDTIKRTTAKLNLDWEAAVTKSYNALFEAVKQALHLNFQDLSYENFTGIRVTPDDLGVTPADVRV
ncbi:MAG: class IV adenylate cyclase [Chloroflexi bacterium]|nr:class IV adenylate cyclase [Chloroflexota bacterium]